MAKKKRKGGRKQLYPDGVRVTLFMPGSLVKKIDRHVQRVNSSRSAVMTALMKQTALDWGILDKGK